MEYDPERALWVPGRRRFLFLGLGATLSSLLPAPPLSMIAAATDTTSTLVFHPVAFTLVYDLPPEWNNP